ncbi:hypothetical protein QYF36_022679 [Acer negundo]|nr:hypothetical protein QYF36_022679 [Acer negundo]
MTSSDEDGGDDWKRDEGGGDDLNRDDDHPRSQERQVSTDSTSRFTPNPLHKSSITWDLGFREEVGTEGVLDAA